MSDFESLIIERLYNKNKDEDFSYGEEFEEEKEHKEHIDEGYEYLLQMRHIMESIKNTKLIQEKASTKLKKWIDIIENDFYDLIKYISEYLSSIKIYKDRGINEIETSEERRRVAHNNLMSSIEKTIRDIRFNFDSKYDINGKNFVFKKKYIESLKEDQNIPDYLTSSEIEKTELDDNLFLPEIFNNSPIPSYKYLSDRRIHITKWAEDIYHSGIMDDKEKIRRLLE